MLYAAVIDSESLAARDRVQRGASKTTMDKVCATMSWDNGDAFMDMLMTSKKS
ncbi:Os01g0145950 [Oryza sativa Japonica Group]|uniref:Os01g0145950 protein n=1 Tax=Oryza sativa subsp. japonica TaxID=39947 RepID=C7IXM2_ORYSJ|nr:Os01g0145950 [Oryza sativa Japonica Group]|eukprot:NP_001172176.1 Os01g0145950 [Oryza sativa Japonica Group]